MSTQEYEAESNKFDKDEKLGNYYDMYIDNFDEKTNEDYAYQKQKLEMNDDCVGDKADGCEPFEHYINVNELARAYIPSQHLCEMYQMDKAIIKGTVFPELYRPYKAKYEYKAGHI